MKKILTAIAILAITATACKKDKNTPVPAPATNNNNQPKPADSPAAKTVNDIKLEITKVNTPVAPHNPGGYSFYTIMLNGALYMGNPSNTGKTQYFDKYDITTNTFTTVDTTKNLCACGYGSKMVTDGGNNIYYIANDATKFSADDNDWTWFAFPTNAKDNHGESGPIYQDKKIFYIGGRTPSRKVKYIDLQTKTWYNAPDFPYATNMVDGVSVDGKIYAMGGTNGKTKFSMYDPAANAWQVLPDLPFETNFWYDRHYVTAVGQNIYVLLDDKIQVYDTKASKWSVNPVTTAFDFDRSYMSIYSWNGKLYIASKSNSGDFQLYQAVIK